MEKGAGIIEKIKEIAGKVRKRFIRNENDFLQVAKENGLIPIDFEQFNKASGLFGREVASKLVLAQITEYEGQKYVVMPGRRSVEVERYEPEFYQQMPEEERRKQKTKNIEKARKQLEEGYGLTPAQKKKILDPKTDPITRMMLVCKKLISDGNAKIDARIGVWSLPCRYTCPGSTEFCREYCYAKKAEVDLFKDTLPKRFRSYLVSLEDNFVEAMTKAIQESKNKQGGRKYDIIRIHEAGDFYSKEYLEKWFQIARNCPDVIFYCYTKADKYIKEAIKEIGEVPKNFRFQASIEVPTKVKFVYKEKGKEIGEEERYLKGTDPERLKNFERLLEEGKMHGLALTLPKGVSLHDALEVLGLGNMEYSFFMCPGYKGSPIDGCGPIEDNLCPFCYLDNEGRQHIAFDGEKMIYTKNPTGKINVYFLQH